MCVPATTIGTSSNFNCVFERVGIGVESGVEGGGVGSRGEPVDGCGRSGTVLEPETIGSSSNGSSSCTFSCAVRMRLSGTAIV
jgi:hypothetical protein